jgi:soluble lytic murein transglycosylase-like protein
MDGRTTTMDSITYFKSSIPNNCGYYFILREALSGYLAKIKSKINLTAIGTVFDSFYSRICRKGFNLNALPRMGEALFTSQLNLQQTVKYGAAFYLMAAMVAIPVGICSNQDRPLNFEYPIIAHAPVPDDLYGASASAQDDASGSGLAQSQEADPPEASQPELPFNAHIMQAAKAYQVDPALIRAIIMAESSNDPKAVSHRGAQGLMQLMPTTAKWLGVDDPFDPAGNIDAGVRYFKKLLNRFDGNVRLALAAYNAGSRYVLKYGGVPPFRATRVYIKRVLNYHRKYSGEMAASGNAPTTS